MKIRHKPLNKTGDTIVEVMIVLTILSLAISVSYSTASQSLINTRRAQENAQATEYVQAQIEALRSLTSIGLPASRNIFKPGPYCVNTSSAVPYSLIATSCLLDNLYKVSVTGPAGAPGGTFTVVATWPDIGGQGDDTVTMLYNLYRSL
ncbi:MAG TPA: type II secretion system protein [Candidatus Saccharimonadales bacterium]|nr:type II secretion system protein [Candidatus Saccharimonadales bacterium]